MYYLLYLPYHLIIELNYSSHDELYAPCEAHDIVILQETWLAKNELSLLSNTHCDFIGNGTLWASKKHFCHLESTYLLLLCGIGYNVVKWPHCEFKRDLLYFFNICNNIIL